MSEDAAAHVQVELQLGGLGHHCLLCVTVFCCDRLVSSASFINQPFPQYHASRWRLAARHDIFEERSYAVKHASPFNDFVPFQNGVAEDLPFHNGAPVQAEVTSIGEWIIFLVGAALVIGGILFG
ncbi:hypothetical protein [Novosphingobium sp. HII-3]|uniref:hypothetical protein n=1 Tax=Novosphingobium sp. HII-3 TaxID=2075565 RepID=UPI001304E484|nr:hypothetical protein [Novosphingobium sp. HII-3]